MRVSLFKLLFERLCLGGFTFTLHRKHDLDTRGEVRIEELPLIRVGCQNNFLVDDQALERS